MQSTSKFGQVLFALCAFIIGNVGFEMGGVFCNAFLPDISPKEKIGRVSGYGWSFGYIGGLLALLICFVLFITPDSPNNLFTGKLLDTNSVEHIRIINILMDDQTYLFFSLLNH